MDEGTRARHEGVVDQEYMDPGMIQTSPDQLSLNDIFLDNTFLIDELMNTLQGKIVDSVNNKIVELEPLIPSEGVGWLVGRILPYTSKIFSLSKLDENKIREMVYEFATDLSSDLMYCEQHGIKRKDRDYIYNMVVQMMEATLRKAFEGTTMIRMLSQHQIREITSRTEGPGNSAKGGIMSRVKL